MRPFDGRRVLLVVAGGISAYKSVHGPSQSYVLMNPPKLSRSRLNNPHWVQRYSGLRASGGGHEGWLKWARRLRC